MAQQETIQATGKRKTAVARVWMKPGKGMIQINKKPIEEYMPAEADRARVMDPLRISDKMDEFDVRVNVKGGGLSGQAEAIRHGISRAVVEVDADARSLLKKQGFLTRDPRMKERKKYGRRGARASYQYSKR